MFGSSCKAYKTFYYLSVISATLNHKYLTAVSSSILGTYLFPLYETIHSLTAHLTNFESSFKTLIKLHLLCEGFLVPLN